MAERLRYVRTSSIAGGDGTADTDSGATRAYPSLNSALSAEAADLVSAGDTLRIVCSTGSGTSADSTAVDATGFTTGASNYIEIEGDFEGTAYDSNVYRVELAQAYGTIFDIDVDYIRVSQLQIYNTNASNFQSACNVTRDTSGDKDIRFNRTIFRLPDGDTNGWAFIEGLGAGSTGTNKLEFKNCLFLEGGQYNINIGYSPGTTNLDVINCTAQNAGTNNLQTANLNTVNLYNNLFDGAGTSDYVLNFNTTDNTGNNISGDATSPDGASWQNITITYTDSGNQDYSYASSETDAYDQGVGNGSQSLVPTDSMNGVDRGTGPTCDVGAFEVSVGGSTVDAAIAESLGFSESQENLALLLSSNNESFFLSESQLNLALLESNNVESIGFSAAKSVVAALVVDSFESLNLSDAVAAQTFIGTVALESFGYSVNQSASAALFSVISDSILFSSQQSNIINLLADGVEAFNFSSVQNTGSIIAAALAESFNLNHLQTSILFLGVDVAESLTFNEDSQVSAALLAALNQGLALDDQLASQSALLASIAETLNFNDLLASIIAGEVTVIDGKTLMVVKTNDRILTINYLGGRIVVVSD